MHECLLPLIYSIEFPSYIIVETLKFYTIEATINSMVAEKCCKIFDGSNHSIDKQSLTCIHWIWDEAILLRCTAVTILVYTRVNLVTTFDSNNLLTSTTHQAWAVDERQMFNIHHLSWYDDLRCGQFGWFFCQFMTSIWMHFSISSTPTHFVINFITTISIIWFTTLNYNCCGIYRRF